MSGANHRPGCAVEKHFFIDSLLEGRPTNLLAPTALHPIEHGMTPNAFSWLWPVFFYLVGSIPAGYLMGLSRGIDIRRHGSGNIGATNVGRVLGRNWGFAAFG